MLSPDDRPQDIVVKVREYLTCGVPLVWIIDPDSRMVTVHSRAQPLTLTSEQLLEGDVFLTGFEIPVSRLFPKDV